MAESKDPSGSDDEAPAPKMTVGDALARLAYPVDGITGSQLREAVENIMGLSDNPKLGEAVRELVGGPGILGLKGIDASAIDASAFERIRQAADANNRLIMEGLSVPRVEIPAYSDVVPFELGPSAEEELLDGLRQDMADLRGITAAQATNVALQAQLAGAQTAKLDELIAAMRESTVAIRDSSALTHKLERTALVVAIVATVLAVIVAIPVVVDIGQWIGEYAGWIQPAP
jgi:hypothetical protein